MPDQLFGHISGPNRHDQVRCQPSTVSLPHYYDSYYTRNLRQRVVLAKVVTLTTSEQLLDI